MWGKLRVAIPWLLASAIVLWLLLTVDLDALGSAFGDADWRRLLVVLPTATLASYLVDSASLHFLFVRFVAPLTFGDVLAIRGASYFFNVINVGAATGAMSWLVKRRGGVTFIRALASQIWLNFVTMGAVLLLLLAGWLLGRGLLPPGYSERIALSLVIGGLIVAGALIYWWAGFDWLVLGRMRSWPIFQTFAEFGPGDLALMLVLRTGFIFVQAALYWAAVPAFGIVVPFGVMIVLAVVLTFVSIVPASVSGIGALQAVMIVLFTPYVLPDAGDPMAQVMAFSLVVTPGMTLCRIVIGYACIRNVSRDYLPTRQALAAERDETAER